jgi:hypothetical protein
MNFLRTKKEQDVLLKAKQRMEKEGDNYLTHDEHETLRKIELNVAFRRFAVADFIAFIFLIFNVGLTLALIIVAFGTPILCYLIRQFVNDSWEPESGHDGYC